MAKRCLIFLLLMVLGLKNISVACQPLVSLADNYDHPLHFYDENAAGEDGTASPKAIIDLLAGMLGDQEADSGYKLIDSQQKACNGNTTLKLFANETTDILPDIRLHWIPARLTQTESIIPFFSVPAHHNFLFLLTLF